MKAVYAPRHSPYFFTHGSFILCNEGGVGSAAPRLKEIDFNIVTPPIEISTVLRTVPIVSERHGPPFDWSPLGGVIGRPGHFPGFKVRGSFSSKFAGTMIEDSCADRKDPNAGFTELLIVMQVGKRGSDIEGFTIDYEVDGEDHELSVPWRMVGCSRSISRKLCT